MRRDGKYPFRARATLSVTMRSRVGNRASNYTPIPDEPKTGHLLKQPAHKADVGRTKSQFHSKGGVAMNLFQNMNHSVFILTLGALATGLLKDPVPLEKLSPFLWTYLLFVLLLRLKIYWDDHKYFESTPTKSVHFKIGVVVGLISSIVWVLSALTVTDLPANFFRVGIAVGVSTVWIVVVAIWKERYKEQAVWIITNTTYILLLWWAYARYVPGSPRYPWVPLLLAIFVVVIDFLVSKSVPELSA
jgi:hypothetical protein